jgi:hypothetical protein
MTRELLELGPGRWKATDLSYADVSYRPPLGPPEDEAFFPLPDVEGREPEDCLGVPTNQLRLAAVDQGLPLPDVFTVGGHLVPVKVERRDLGKGRFESHSKGVLRVGSLDLSVRGQATWTAPTPGFPSPSPRLPTFFTSRTTSTVSSDVGEEATTTVDVFYDLRQQYSVR